MLLIYETIQLTCKISMIVNGTYENQRTGDPVQHSIIYEGTSTCPNQVTQCAGTEHSFTQTFREYGNQLLPDQIETLDGDTCNIINKTMTKFQGGVCPFGDTVQDCEQLFGVTCQDVTGQQMETILYYSEIIDQNQTEFEETNYVELSAVPTEDFEFGVDNTDDNTDDNENQGEDDNNNNDSNNDNENNTDNNGDGPNVGMIVGIVVAAVVVVAAVSITVGVCVCKKKQKINGDKPDKKITKMN